MNEFLTALFLGFVEGLTEFIPVSSTAHLIILVDKLKFEAPANHVFEVFIQLGAIMAVMFLYRQKLWQTATNFHRDEKDRRFLFNLILGTIPAVIAGGLGRDWIKENLYDPYVIATSLIIGGFVILFFERRLNKPKITDIDHIPAKTAFYIGCCQMIALIPGVSRSGATIMGSLGLGLARPAAAEFSFFLAVPVMLLAVSYDTFRNWQEISIGGYYDIMLVGLFSAFATALVVIKFALHIISRYGFVPFAWYRIVMGILILIVYTL